MIARVQRRVVNRHVHADDQAAAHERTAKSDYLAGRQTAIQRPVDSRRQCFVGAVGVEVEPHPVDTGAVNKRG